VVTVFDASEAAVTIQATVVPAAAPRESMIASGEQVPTAGRDSASERVRTPEAPIYGCPRYWGFEGPKSALSLSEFWGFEGKIA